MTRSGTLATSALAVGACALVIWAFLPDPLPVDVGAVVQGPFESRIDEEARTRLSDRYAITAPAGGRVDRIALREGDTVSAGQEVARLRPASPPLS